MFSGDRERGDGQEDEGGGAMAIGGVIDVTLPQAKDMVDSLMSMGIGREKAEMAVRQTGAETAEAAIAWVFENQGVGDNLEEDDQDDMFQDFKMVFVVNTSLPMTPGKMAAQVGHATQGLYQHLLGNQDIFGGPLLQWNENGGRKIVLQCTDANEMNELAKKAGEESLPFYIVQDAGHTQIPAGSQTVLGIFGVVSEVDKVTGKLKLLP